MENIPLDRNRQFIHCLFLLLWELPASHILFTFLFTRVMVVIDRDIVMKLTIKGFSEIIKECIINKEISFLGKEEKNEN